MESQRNASCSSQLSNLTSRVEDESVIDAKYLTNFQSLLASEDPLLNLPRAVEPDLSVQRSFSSVTPISSAPGKGTMKFYAMQMLSEIGLNEVDIKKFSSRLGPKGFSALANYKIACGHMELPTAWGDAQIRAYHIYTNFKYYEAQYLTRMWNVIKELGEFLLCPVSEGQEADFELVKMQAREMKDNKVPVSRQLLKDLCQAADIVFAEYNVALAKVMFIAAWAGYMRISEYSRTSGKNGNQHNLRNKSLLSSPAGLSFHFHSDKTSKGSLPMRHRFVPWRELPSLSRKAFQDYDRLRPKQAYNYFCREDGIELTRSYVMNLLETCLLLMDYRDLHVTPHCFRLGKASYDRLKGVNMREIEDRGRWGHKSKAIEAYTRPDIVVSTPQCLWEDLPKYRKQWTHQRLAFMANNTVEKASKLVVHPFHEMLSKFYPDLMNYPERLPEQYPGPDALQRLSTIRKNRQSKVFLKQFSAAEARKLRDCFSRGNTASMLRKEARKRIQGASMPFSAMKYSAKVGISANKAVQVSNQAPVVADFECQTDPVVVITPEEFQHLETAVQSSSGPAEVAIPENPSLQEKLLIGFAEEPVFAVTSFGHRLALTKKEALNRKKIDPKLSVSQLSLSARQRSDLRAKIRRRISKRYRDRRNNSRLPPRKQPKDDHPLRKTRSVLRLMEYFMDEIKLRGEDGLPVWKEDLDPLVTDDDYEEEVLTAYKNKPSDYEQILAVKLHDGSYQRQLNSRRKAPSGTKRGRPRKIQTVKESSSSDSDSVPETPALKLPRKGRQSRKEINYCEASSSEEKMTSPEIQILPRSLRKTLGYSPLSSSSLASTVVGSACTGIDGNASAEEVVSTLMHSLEAQEVLPW